MSPLSGCALLARASGIERLLGCRVAGGGRPRVWCRADRVHATGGGKPAGCLPTGPDGCPAGARLLLHGEAAHRVRGRRVDLKAITAPILIIGADRDTICPLPAAKALIERSGSSDTQVLQVPGGHVGAVVGSRASHDLYPATAAWLRERLDRANIDFAHPFDFSAQVGGDSRRTICTRPGWIICIGT